MTNYIMGLSPEKPRVFALYINGVLENEFLHADLSYVLNTYGILDFDRYTFGANELVNDDGLTLFPHEVTIGN